MGFLWQERHMGSSDCCCCGCCWSASMFVVVGEKRKKKKKEKQEKMARGAGIEIGGLLIISMFWRYFLIL